ncbi:MAG: transglutaminase domain-containing protein, partial [Treponemataceae bacterium]|nr:transglutaminase domain-containing protein [Treponemataceae bacterium]
MNEIEFYKKTSCFTELGLYKNFAQALPDDIRELCLLQRHQIIHPVAIMKCGGQKQTFHGDMTQIPCDSLLFENERFPTALSILAELLRRENEYSCQRKIQNKMHLTCREQAILLTAILKAKEIPARARSGFAPYISNDGFFHDHWICERFCYKENRWILTDADCCVENLDF